eukprot:SAG11_NODE_1564_length_4675_cov_2.781687_3_plen_80_part_00
MLTHVGASGFCWRATPRRLEAGESLTAPQKAKIATRAELLETEALILAADAADAEAAAAAAAGGGGGAEEPEVMDSWDD